MDEPVTDGAADGRVPDDRMPVGRIELTGDEGGRDVGAIFEDFEQAFAFGGAERFESEVVELCGAPHKSTNSEPTVM